MRERRRHVRVKPDAIWISFRVGDRVVRAPVIDLSAGGARAGTNEPLWRGTYLECDVEVDDTRRITLAGFVLDDTAERDGLALSFLRPGDTSAAALSATIEYLLATRRSRRSVS